MVRSTQLWRRTRPAGLSTTYRLSTFDPRGRGEAIAADDDHTRPPRYRGCPGAVLTYDVRGIRILVPVPPLLLIGSPMGAAEFGTLAGHFPDRTVVTYDPRGAERSTKADSGSPSTPDEHADDLHRVITVLGVGPVDLFASSGGAVNALALVSKHPEDVRVLIAHEPPADTRSCQTADQALAVNRAVEGPGTYPRQSQDSARGWRISSRS